jgi:hypothetical protein
LGETKELVWLTQTYSYVKLTKKHSGSFSAEISVVSTVTSKDRDTQRASKVARLLSNT